MTERPVNNETKADDISRSSAEAKATDLTCALPKTKPDTSFPEKAEGQRPNTNRRFTQEYYGKTADEFEFNDWLLPSLDLEHYEPNIKEEAGVADESKGSTRYAWIGAGQCGGRLVKCFYDLGYKKALAVNTTRRDLELLDLPESQKFLMDIGEESTDRDIARGAEAVQQHRQEILHLARRIFGTQVDHIMVSFGAGGGTGSGSVVGLVEIAKRYARYIGLEKPSRKVGVVMTLPAAGKVGSPMVAQNAYKVAKKLSQMATAGEISPLIIVDNDKINKMYPKMTIKPFWAGINGTVANLFAVFNRLSNSSSPYTSFDPSNYRGIVESGGCLIMGLTKVDRLDDPLAISEAVKKGLDRSLFAGGLDLSTAKLGGCIVIGGKELMANVKGLRDNIDYAFDVLSETTGQASIYRGIYEDNRNCLRVYTIIGGLSSPAARLEKLSTDLYFQPDVVDTEALPLRERREDILPLAELFLAKEANLNNRPDKMLSSKTNELLLNYSWPGNVGELAKAMERASELASGREIEPDVLPFQIIFSDSEPYPKRILPSLDQVRRRIIIKALDLTRGREPTARLLGIEPNRLNRLIEQLNIHVVKRSAPG